MRTLHVVNSLACGGLEKLVVDLSAELNRDRWDSLVCCLEEEGALGPYARAHGVRVHALSKPPGVRPGLVGHLARLIRRERIDVVHTHNMGPLVYGSVAARLAGVRAVLNTRHGREWKRSPRWVWALNRAVVAISDDAKARLLQSNAIPAEKVQVIHNGIDLRAFDMPAGASGTSAARSVQGSVIGTVARLAPEKDQDTLLQAVAVLRAAGTNAQLWIVGEGDRRAELEGLAKRLGLNGHATFLGFQSDVASWLARMDVFVLPSLTEGISLTLLEAMAAGKPVVATRVGGNAEVVDDGVTGFLVPAHDPDGLAAAIGRLLADGARAARMGAAGRRRVETHFSLAQMAGAYRQLYARLSDQ